MSAGRPMGVGLRRQTVLHCCPPGARAVPHQRRCAARDCARPPRVPDRDQPVLACGRKVRAGGRPRAAHASVPRLCEDRHLAPAGRRGSVHVDMAVVANAHHVPARMGGWVWGGWWVGGAAGGGRPVRVNTCSGCPGAARPACAALRSLPTAGGLLAAGHGPWHAPRPRARPAPAVVGRCRGLTCPRG